MEFTISHGIYFYNSAIFAILCRKITMRAGIAPSGAMIYNVFRKMNGNSDCNCEVNEYESSEIHRSGGPSRIGAGALRLRRIRILIRFRRQQGRLLIRRFFRGPLRIRDRTGCFFRVGFIRIRRLGLI